MSNEAPTNVSNIQTAAWAIVIFALASVFAFTPALIVWAFSTGHLSVTVEMIR